MDKKYKIKIYRSITQENHFQCKNIPLPYSHREQHRMVFVKLSAYSVFWFNRKPVLFHPIASSRGLNHFWGSLRL